MNSLASRKITEAIHQSAGHDTLWLLWRLSVNLHTSLSRMLTPHGHPDPLVLGRISSFLDAESPRRIPYVLWYSVDRSEAQYNRLC
jgi:hypothetical protein